MSHLILTIRKPRRDALYFREEIAVPSKYKAEYKDQTTKPLRAHVLRNKILVNIFNYWDVQKTLPADEEACVDWMKVNEMVKSERLQNLTHGLETCCLDAKQLVVKSVPKYRGNRCRSAGKRGKVPRSVLGSRICAGRRAWLQPGGCALMGCRCPISDGQGWAKAQPGRAGTRLRE